VSPIDVGLQRSEPLLGNGFRDERALADPRGAEALSCVSFRGHVVPEVRQDHLGGLSLRLGGDELSVPVEIRAAPFRNTCATGPDTIVNESRTGGN
jgi:hypothetical protein